MRFENKEGVPAWLICEDILTRTKDELILEAIDILKKEMKEGRVDIKGYVAALPEKGQELEQDLFIVKNLVSRAPEIREQYKDYMKREQAGEITDPETVSRAEGLKRFLMSVDAIDLLMRYSTVFGMWADDVGVYSSLNDPVDIMVKTANMDEERVDALNFTLSSKTFEKNDAISNEERQLFEETSHNAHAGHAHRRN